MRTITKTITVYHYNELPEDIKDKVLSNLCDINVNYNWWDYIKQDAKEVGFEISEFDIDRGSFVKGKFTNSALDCATKIIQEHGNTCETYKDAKNFIKEREELINKAEKTEYDELINSNDIYALEDIETMFLKTISEDYLTLLRNEYEYDTSKEAIEESIKANEYEFTIDGKIYKE